MAKLRTHAMANRFSPTKGLIQFANTELQNVFALKRNRTECNVAENKALKQ